jgi:hypothetical protein
VKSRKKGKADGATTSSSSSSPTLSFPETVLQASQLPTGEDQVSIFAGFPLEIKYQILQDVITLSENAISALDPPQNSEPRRYPIYCDSHLLAAPGRKTNHASIVAILLLDSNTFAMFARAYYRKVTLALGDPIDLSNYLRNCTEHRFQTLLSIYIHLIVKYDYSAPKGNYNRSHIRDVRKLTEVLKSYSSQLPHLQRLKVKYINERPQPMTEYINPVLDEAWHTINSNGLGELSELESKLLARGKKRNGIFGGWESERRMKIALIDPYCPILPYVIAVYFLLTRPAVNG